MRMACAVKRASLVMLPLLAFLAPEPAEGAADVCVVTGGSCTLTSLPVDPTALGCTGPSPLCSGGDNNDIVCIGEQSFVSEHALQFSKQKSFTF